MAQQRILTVSVESHERSLDRTRELARRIDAGSGYQGEHFSFETLPLLFEVFTPKRWELLNKLRALGPSSLRHLARSLGRDVKRVHEDVARLIEEGIIERDADRKLVVPFERIHIAVEVLNPSAAA